MDINYSTELHIIGCGGIGSYFAPVLSKFIEQEKLFDGDNVTVYDYDVVSTANLKHQNFYTYDVNIPKALVIAERYKFNGCVAKVSKDMIRKLFTRNNVFMVVCVDNKQMRKDIYDVYKELKDTVKNIGFIDMRASGEGFGYFTDEVPYNALVDSLGDLTDIKAYSCQRQVDKNNDITRLGNFVVPLYGFNYIYRAYTGHDAKTDADSAESKERAKPKMIGVI